jgi:transcriptional regulator with XRE-family HTH domain
MYPNLKLRLWEGGVRQNQLARMLEIDESLLSRIVNGFRQPTEELKKRIASLLEADEQWLFDAGERLPHSRTRNGAADRGKSCAE